MPTHVVYSRRGRLTSERGVGSMEVVVVQPLRERPAAVLVRHVQFGIGPFGKRCAGLENFLRQIGQHCLFEFV